MQLLALTLVLGFIGWLIGGGLLSKACRQDWATGSDRTRWRTLLQGYAAAMPLALVFKYGVLTQIELPSLGRSLQAAQLEASLAGLTVSNVIGDSLGMLLALVLWRAVLLRNPEIFL